LKLFRILYLSLSILALLTAIFLISSRLRTVPLTDTFDSDRATGNLDERPIGDVRSQSSNRFRTAADKPRDKKTIISDRRTGSKHRDPDTTKERESDRPSTERGSHRETSARPPVSREEELRQLKKIESTWASEPYDEEWSLEVEDYLEDQFSIVNINPINNEVSCKKRVCRAKVTFENAYAASKLYKFPDNPDIDEPFIKIDYEKDGTVNVSIYFPKEGIKMKDIYQ
jgi:hypothetical protein